MQFKCEKEVRNGFLTDFPCMHILPTIQEPEKRAAVFGDFMQAVGMTFDDMCDTAQRASFFDDAKDPFYMIGAGAVRKGLRSPKSGCTYACGQGAYRGMHPLLSQVCTSCRMAKNYINLYKPDEEVIAAAIYHGTFSLPAEKKLKFITRETRFYVAEGKLRVAQYGVAGYIAEFIFERGLLPDPDWDAMQVVNAKASQINVWKYLSKEQKKELRSWLHERVLAVLSLEPTEEEAMRAYSHIAENRRDSAQARDVSAEAEEARKKTPELSSDAASEEAPAKTIPVPEPDAAGCADAAASGCMTDRHNEITARTGPEDRAGCMPQEIRKETGDAAREADSAVPQDARPGISPEEEAAAPSAALPEVPESKPCGFYAGSIPGCLTAYSDGVCMGYIDAIMDIDLVAAECCRVDGTDGLLLLTESPKLRPFFAPLKFCSEEFIKGLLGCENHIFITMNYELLMCLARTHNLRRIIKCFSIRAAYCACIDREDEDIYPFAAYKRIAGLPEEVPYHVLLQTYFRIRAELLYEIDNKRGRRDCYRELKTYEELMASAAEYPVITTGICNNIERTGFREHRLKFSRYVRRRMGGVMIRVRYTIPPLSGTDLRDYQIKLLRIMFGQDVFHCFPYCLFELENGWFTLWAKTMYPRNFAAIEDAATLALLKAGKAFGIRNTTVEFDYLK